MRRPNRHVTDYLDTGFEPTASSVDPANARSHSQEHLEATFHERHASLEAAQKVPEDLPPSRRLGPATTNRIECLGRPRLF